MEKSFLSKLGFMTHDEKEELCQEFENLRKTVVDMVSILQELKREVLSVKEEHSKQIAEMKELIHEIATKQQEHTASASKLMGETFQKIRESTEDIKMDIQEKERNIQQGNRDALAAMTSGMNSTGAAITERIQSLSDFMRECRSQAVEAESSQSEKLLKMGRGIEEVHGDLLKTVQDIKVMNDASEGKLLCQMESAMADIKAECSGVSKLLVAMDKNLDEKCQNTTEAVEMTKRQIQIDVHSLRNELHTIVRKEDLSKGLENTEELLRLIATNQLMDYADKHNPSTRN